MSRNHAPVYPLSGNEQWGVLIYKIEGKEHVVQFRVPKSVSSGLYQGHLPKNKRVAGFKCHCHDICLNIELLRYIYYTCVTTVMYVCVT